MAFALGDPHPPNPLNDAKLLILGKAVVIDIGTGEIDARIFGALKEPLCAARPEEVKTVIWTRYTQEKLWKYTDDRDAIQLSCHLTIIDLDRAVILREVDIHGKEPPKELKYPGDSAIGLSPVYDVVQYLNGRLQVSLATTRESIIEGQQMSCQWLHPSGQYEQLQACLRNSRC